MCSKTRASLVDESELESPFLDREVLAPEERRQGVPGDWERQYENPAEAGLHDESPYGSDGLAIESPFAGGLDADEASPGAEELALDPGEAFAEFEGEDDERFAGDEERRRVGPLTAGRPASADWSRRGATRQTGDREEHERPASAAVRPAATTVDAEAAEPIFVGRVRLPELPLLDAATVKASSRWNQARHAKVSGITLGELRERLERYIDRQALDAAVKRANAGSTSAYGADEATIVTLLAHQFQRKTCRTPTVGDVLRPCTIDGRLAEDTLDALGFVYHAGKDLNAADRSNTVATATLRRVSASAFTGLEPGLKASSWWSYMVSPPWLGMPIKQGIHLVLLKRLRRAQRALMQLPAYAGLSPAELGRVLGIEEEHKGARPTSPDWSMHLFGLGIDIGFTRNPWVTRTGGDPAKVAAITLRAARLVGTADAGTRGVSGRWLHDLAVAHRDTAAIYRTLSDWTRWLQEYFALAGDAKRLEGLLPLANVKFPDGKWFARNESLAAAASRWTRVIRADFNDFASAVARGGQKDEVRHGFMDLARELVIALRDDACLGWGAVDFGPGVSGDVMHFDCRVDGIGRAIATTGGRAYVPRSGHHPCLPAVAPSAAQPELAEQPEFERQTPRKKAPPPPPCAVPATTAGRWLTAWPSRAIPNYPDASGKKQSTGCAINVPDALWLKKKVDLLVFFHGHPGPCTACFDPAPNAAASKFGLDTQIQNASRKVVLAVPVMHWIVRKGDTAANLKGVWSAANFNAFVAEILAEIQDQSNLAGPVELGSLIIAGHSRAYAVMTPLALEFNRGAEATKKGALAKLQEVWALDSTYGAGSARALEAWAAAAPHVRFVAVLNKTLGPAADPKPIDGWNAYYDPTWRTFGFGPPPNLRMCKVDEKHCAIPTKYVGNLLSTTKSSPDWCTP